MNDGRGINPAAVFLAVSAAIAFDSKTRKPAATVDEFLSQWKIALSE